MCACVAHRSASRRCGSLRSTLCLEYTPKQLAYAILFVAITVMSLEPASGMGSVSVAPTKLPSLDQTWLDLLEKQMNETILKSELS